MNVRLADLIKMSPKEIRDQIDSLMDERALIDIEIAGWQGLIPLAAARSGEVEEREPAVRETARVYDPRDVRSQSSPVSLEARIDAPTEEAPATPMRTWSGLPFVGDLRAAIREIVLEEPSRTTWTIDALYNEIDRRNWLAGRTRPAVAMALKRMIDRNQASRDAVGVYAFRELLAERATASQFQSEANSAWTVGLPQSDVEG